MAHASSAVDIQLAVRETRDCLDTRIGDSSRAAATGPIYLAGDSSGGGLALAAARSRNISTHPRPLGPTLMSRWLDITLSNPDIDAIAPRDGWHRPGFGYAVEPGPVTFPSMTPASALSTATSPTYPRSTSNGDHDIFLADCRRPRDTAPPGEVVTSHEEPGAIHVYPRLPVPEIHHARTELIAQHRGCVPIAAATRDKCQVTRRAR